MSQCLGYGWVRVCICCLRQAHRSISSTGRLQRNIIAMQMGGVQLLIQPSCVSARTGLYVLQIAWRETEADTTILQRSIRLWLSDTRDSQNHGRNNNNKTLHPLFVSKDMLYEHGQDRTLQHLPLYLEPPTPLFCHASSHSKATCLFEYRIELYWQLALVLIPPPKTIHSCQRVMQMHRASEMPLQHFRSMPLGWDVPFLQKGMFSDSR